MGIDMTTNPNKSTKKSEDEESKTLIAESTQTKQEIYPEVNGRLKGMVVWLGLAFVVVVFLVQYYSGYN
jgi:hypothetical protein